MKPSSDDNQTNSELYQLLFGSRDVGSNEVDKGLDPASELYRLFFGKEEASSSPAASAEKPSPTLSEGLKARLREIKREALQRHKKPLEPKRAPVLTDEMKAKIRAIRAQAMAPKLSEEWETRLSELGVSDEMKAKLREIIVLALGPSK
jgi:hypothetical protein